jgi:putative membrane protein
MFVASADLVSPWRFQAHPEVWLLVAVVIGAYFYAVRVIGPVVVKSGPVITKRQRNSFIAGILLLWLSSDWPVHDLAEEYLYSMHMFQHMALSYFMPPLVLLAIPKWMFDAVFGFGITRSVINWLSKPVVAGVVFNVVVMITHIPLLVNQSVNNGLLHYSLHILLVVTALLVWLPICGPDEQRQLKSGGKMIYLFLMSVVPTVPAAWLTFAEGAVYKHYDIAVRVWGLSVTTDQQVAGAIMKTGGAVFLWSIVVFLFFKRFSAGFLDAQSYRKDSTADNQVLTYQDVTDAFGRVAPVKERNAKN